MQNWWSMQFLCILLSILILWYINWLHATDLWSFIYISLRIIRQAKTNSFHPMKEIHIFNSIFVMVHWRMLFLLFYFYFIPLKLLLLKFSKDFQPIFQKKKTRSFCKTENCLNYRIRLSKFLFSKAKLVKIVPKRICRFLVSFNNLNIHLVTFRVV